MKKLTLVEINDHHASMLLNRKVHEFSERIKDSEVPEGWYRYSIRLGERGFLGSLQKNVWESHVCDVLTQEPILSIEEGEVKYIDLEAEGPNIEVR